MEHLKSQHPTVVLLANGSASGGKWNEAVVRRIVPTLRCLVEEVIEKFDNKLGIIERNGTGGIHRLPIETITERSTFPHFA